MEKLDYWKIVNDYYKEMLPIYGRCDIGDINRFVRYLQKEYGYPPDPVVPPKTICEHCNGTGKFIKNGNIVTSIDGSECPCVWCDGTGIPVYRTRR